MNLKIFILLMALVIFALIIYHNYEDRGMTYVKSDVDGDIYMVQDRKDKIQAANLLANVKANIYKITEYMYKKTQDPTTNNTERYKEYYPYIMQLKDKIKDVVIRESSGNSVYTSYTVNKGEKIIFCIRSKNITNYLQNGSNIHDLNVIMYVALHEISHVGCPEYNHTPLFKKIFRFICEEAIELGIYKKLNFASNPREYCGMLISNSIV